MKVESCSYNEYPTSEKVTIAVSITHEGAVAPDADEIGEAVATILAAMNSLRPTMPNPPKE